MSRAWAVAKREYLFRVKKKSFLFLTLLGPLLIVAIYSLPVLFMAMSGGERRLAVADVSGTMGERFRIGLEERGRVVAEEGDATDRENKGAFSLDRTRIRLQDATQPGETLEQARTRLNRALAADAFDAYLILGPDPDAEGNFIYGSRSSANVPGAVEWALAQAATTERARQRGLGLDAEEIGALTKRVRITPIRVNKAGEQISEGAGQRAVAIGLVWGMNFVFYLTFLIWGATIIQGVVEEKSSRIVEVLLSSLTPSQFMVGKVSGIAAVALTQLVVWVVCAVAAVLSGTAALPQIAGALSAVDLGLFPWFVLLFLTGFAMYSMLYAAVGAMGTNNQEAQQTAQPVTLFVIIAFFCLFAVQRSPDSAFAVGASLFPLTAPLVLLMRLGITDPPAWQIALSVALQFAAVAGIAWLAARVFRIGILIYGKRITIPELWKALRAASAA